MLVLREKANHISIWIFIVNVMKGVSLSTHLKVIFYMKCWIPPMSCSFQPTQHWCIPLVVWIVPLSPWTIAENPVQLIYFKKYYLVNNNHSPSVSALKNLVIVKEVNSVAAGLWKQNFTNWNVLLNNNKSL